MPELLSGTSCGCQRPLVEPPAAAKGLSGTSKEALVKPPGTLEWLNGASCGSTEALVEPPEAL